MEITISVSLIIISIIFTILFYSKLRSATREYETSREIVQAIALTSKISIEKQKKQIEKIEYEIENIQSQIEQNISTSDNNQEIIEVLLSNITSILQITKKLSDNIILLNKKISSSTIPKKNILNNVQTVNEKSLNNVTNQDPDFQTEEFNLTSTEQNILQVLLEEGAKTAPQIQKEIRKTREHTSRLLKKLWQEGFIDRETHSIPYKYRPSNELQNRIKYSSE